MAQQKTKRFFAILMIVVGCLEIVEGAYALYRTHGQGSTSQLIFHFGLGAGLIAIGSVTLKSTKGQDSGRKDV